MKLDIDAQWKNMLARILDEGRVVNPRGLESRELMPYTIRIDARRPVLRSPARKLNYSFLAAEAYWILSGDNKVETIAPYNRNIAKFSDDGRTFFGAYGPRISSQLGYVVHKLLKDRDTRQAGLTIWLENPPETKDTPCTVAIFFAIRGGGLFTNVFMRSWDTWLGAPYDLFNFSMLAHLVCNRYNEERADHLMIYPGDLTVTAVSAHLYQPNYEAARRCVEEPLRLVPQQPTPIELFFSELHFMNYLRRLRDEPEKRWWV